MSDDDSSLEALGLTNSPTMNQPEDYVPLHEREASLAEKVNSKKNSTRTPRWPQLGSLFPSHEKDIRVLLTQVQECECVKQPNASNVNPKGNRWVRLYMNCYGGTSDGSRGALANTALVYLSDAVP